MILIERSMSFTIAARLRFPLPFRRGEGQGEGTTVCKQHAPLRSYPLTPLPLGGGQGESFAALLNYLALHWWHDVTEYEHEIHRH
jgi:hypothetical protein